MTERYVYDKGNGTVRDTVTRAVKYDELDPYSGAIVANAMNELDTTQAENDALRAQLKAANAKLDAVPVASINYYWLCTTADAATNADGAKYARFMDADRAIVDWLRR